MLQLVEELLLLQSNYTKLISIIMKKELEAKREELRFLEMKVADLKQQNDTYKQETETSKTKFELESLQAEELQKKIGNLEADFNRKREEYEELLTRVNDAIKSRAETEEAVRLNESRLSELDQSLKEEEAARDEVVSMAKEKMEEMASTSQQLNDKMSALNEFQKELDIREQLINRREAILASQTKLDALN